MEFTPQKLNTFTFFKLPSVWWSGIRITKIDSSHAQARVKHRWINQNPFQSMFWAVQGMAAELTTGVLIMREIKQSGERISMLVAHNKASFTKKATGVITFTCTDGSKIADAITQASETGEGQTFWMKSVGTDALGDMVSEFDFEWTIKLKRGKV